MPSPQSPRSAARPQSKWEGFFTYAKGTWGRLTNFQRGVIVGLFLVGGILGISMGFLPDILQTGDFALLAYTITAFVGGPISGSTYLSRSLDFRGKWEKILTPLFSISGLFMGIVLLATRIFAPPVGHTVAVIVRIGLFLLSQVSIYGGMGNRFGSLLDSDPNNTKQRSIWEKSFMFVIACGMAIFLSCAAGFAHAALVTAIKTTTVLSAGAALPVWMLVLGSVGFTSMSYSMGDYLSKTISYFRVTLPRYFSFLPQPSDKLRQCVAVDREHEYRGAAVGTTIGIFIGIALILTLSIFAPQVVGTAAIFAGIFLMVMSISTGGGLGSRIGHLVDGLRVKQAEAQEAKKDKLEPGIEPELEPDHDHERKPKVVVGLASNVSANVSLSSIPVATESNIQSSTIKMRRAFSSSALVEQHKSQEAPAVVLSAHCRPERSEGSRDLSSRCLPERSEGSRNNFHEQISWKRPRDPSLRSGRQQTLCLGRQQTLHSGRQQPLCLGRQQTLHSGRQQPLRSGRQQTIAAAYCTTPHIPATSVQFPEHVATQALCV